MKIAVSATGPDLDAPADSRFGRCPWFVFVQLEDMSCEGVPNLSATLGSGSGIQAARLVADRGASVVLTGSCGPNAWDTLAAADVDVVLGCEGTVRQLVERYRDGRLRPGAESDVTGPAGLPASRRAVAGPVMGRGKGRGRGGGRGGRGTGGVGAGMGRGRRRQ
jgi:predicted Fe-Mo cluster-binding NifX family protein